MTPSSAGGLLCGEARRHDGHSDASAPHKVGDVVGFMRSKGGRHARSCRFRALKTASSALFAVGVTVGLRRGKLLALAWDDVDLDGGILRVRRTVQRLRGQGLVFGPPKSIRSRRSIPLPASSRAAVLYHRERQEVERLTPGDSWGSRAWSSQRPWARLWSRRIRFHDLRHTCASLLLAQGVSPRVVIDVLGHSQLSIAMDLYSHVMPSALRDAADAMDRALSGRR